MTYKIIYKSSSQSGRDLQLLVVPRSYPIKLSLASIIISERRIVFFHGI